MVSNLFVVFMGLGTVFFGLICIILIIMAMSAVIRYLERPKEKAMPEKNAEGLTDAKAMAIILAVLSDELGVNVKDIRITRKG